MKIAGIHSGHDCSFCILENGVPTFHAELERYIRLKQPIGDALKFLYEEYPEHNEIKHFANPLDIWQGGILNRHPETYRKMTSIMEKNDGKFFQPGHHQSHAANCFFSSNFNEALIVTLDGGGPDFIEKINTTVPVTITFWHGIGNKIYPLGYVPEDQINIGSLWNLCTTKVFGLSGGYPKGDQAGSVMAMGSMGNPEKYVKYFQKLAFKHFSRWTHSEKEIFNFLIEEGEKGEKQQFDIAASLQKCTEEFIEKIIEKYIDKVDTENLCLSGGVSLNSAMTGKMFDWYNNKFKNIYVCPVPYDGGLAIGAAQYVWHHILDNPRINWKDNASPYLGVIYSQDQVQEALHFYDDKIKIEKINLEDALTKLLDGKIVSVFSGGSESGRRALGNRSILADPRNPKMKDIINEKVKHRQWYRPFAPSILREEVGNWFERDIDSPYMSFVLKFKKEMGDKVPAVNHFDGTARLQTVTKKDNKEYYNLLKKWHELSGVPIILNTSFNDREPIVESPKHALNCFLGTDIDYLYFINENILVSKK